jgi:hypothetical protein
MTTPRQRRGWIDITPAPEHFRSWPDGGWPVEEQEVVTYAYRLDGDMLFLQFVLEATSVAFDLTELYLALPPRYVAARSAFQFFQALNASAWGAVGTARVQPGDNVIRLQSTEAGAGWAASDHQTCVRGLFIVQVVEPSTSSSNERDTMPKPEQPIAPAPPAKPEPPERPSAPDGPGRPDHGRPGAPERPTHPDRPGGRPDPEPPTEPEPKK